MIREPDQECSSTFCPFALHPAIRLRPSLISRHIFPVEKSFKLSVNLSNKSPLKIPIEFFAGERMLPSSEATEILLPE
jgi:hypothetical protein